MKKPLLIFFFVSLVLFSSLGYAIEIETPSGEIISYQEIEPSIFNVFASYDIGTNLCSRYYTNYNGICKERITCDSKCQGCITKQVSSNLCTGGGQDSTPTTPVSESGKCSDGTPKNTCVTGKQPLYCQQFITSTKTFVGLVNDAEKCGCPIGFVEGSAKECVKKEDELKCRYGGTIFDGDKGERVCASSGNGVYSCLSNKLNFEYYCRDSTSCTPYSINVNSCCPSYCFNGCFSDGSCRPSKTNEICGSDVDCPINNQCQIISGKNQCIVCQATEICGNEKDDDCDGFVDSEDSTCNYCIADNECKICAKGSFGYLTKQLCEDDLATGVVDETGGRSDLATGCNIKEREKCCKIPIYNNNIKTNEFKLSCIAPNQMPCSWRDGEIVNPTFCKEEKVTLTPDGTIGSDESEGISGGTKGILEELLNDKTEDELEDAKCSRTSDCESGAKCKPFDELSTKVRERLAKGIFNVKEDGVCVVPISNGEDFNFNQLNPCSWGEQIAGKKNGCLVGWGIVVIIIILIVFSRKQ